MGGHWITGTRYGSGSRERLILGQTVFGRAQNQETEGVEAVGKKRNDQGMRFWKKLEGSRQNQAHRRRDLSEKELFETGRKERWYGYK